ncbi:MAG: ferrichrome ABC transporter permease [Verrucomicrobia bacterium]|nr:MAG: ferrichrome ABC transporter permease [Verrucomicrobiota bacterium]
MFFYALTIFLGAFLLFQVQPLIGKFILPWFGGGPGVWTTCLLFFQTLLLGGYAYAHVSARALKPRGQAWLHVVLLLGALALLPVTPGEAWKPAGAGDPVWQILKLLTVCLGLPYFVLSSTGPLMQQWFSRSQPGVSPYRLYALSNLGSLLALVSYPFAVETHFTRRAQAELWAWGFGAFVVSATWCAWKFWRHETFNTQHSTFNIQRSDAATPALNSDESRAGSQLSTLNQLLWLLLPACASALLLSVTNKICQDVAVIPFLWVLPLAIYLLSFILCFDHPRWYARLPFTLALVAALSGICWALFQGVGVSIRWQVEIYSVGLFVCCMVCHGELCRLKPAPQQLTRFYLLIAAGGALGGLFVAVIAPLRFHDYYELHWSLLACAVLFFFVCCREKDFLTPNAWRWLTGALMLAVFVGLDLGIASLARRHPHVSKSLFIGLRLGMWSAVAVLVASWILRGKWRTFRAWRFLACLWLLVGVAALGVALRLQAQDDDDHVIARSRNFYGALKVCEFDRAKPDRHYLLLQHGRITHGLQFTDPEMSAWPTTYFTRDSGAGVTLRAFAAGKRRVGFIGLGVGTVATYGEKGDEFRFYEINPQVLTMARAHFTYLSNCAAHVEMVLGDARLSLEREPSQNLDALIIDAFSSDAIPVHLLTRDAFEVYARHLKPGGIIAVHISNRYLNLTPVVANVARHFDYHAVAVDTEEDDESDDWWNYPSNWILLTHDEALLQQPPIVQSARAVKTGHKEIPLWTDDFTGVFQILK